MTDYKFPTKIAPAPLAFPNGGGLKHVSTGAGKRQKLERDALEAKHEVERAQLAEKHAKENQPKTSATKSKPKTTGSK